MEDITKICRDNLQYQHEWPESLRSMIEQLEERTKQVVLKNKKFTIGKPASNDEVQSDELPIIQNIDKLIMKGKYQKQDMKSCKDFQAFLANHCRVQHYTFQIRKCNDPACCLLYGNPGQKIDWLPDPLLLGNKEHFKPFTDVLRKETTEKDLPSSNVPTATEVASIQ